jgi:hypothetical protein
MVQSPRLTFSAWSETCACAEHKSDVLPHSAEHAEKVWKRYIGTQPPFNPKEKGENRRKDKGTHTRRRGSFLRGFSKSSWRFLSAGFGAINVAWRSRHSNHIGTYSHERGHFLVERVLRIRARSAMLSSTMEPSHSTSPDLPALKSSGLGVAVGRYQVEVSAPMESVFGGNQTRECPFIACRTDGALWPRSTKQCADRSLYVPES